MRETQMLFLVLALTFSPMAAAMAFLITYQEYQHHFDNKKHPLKAALETAVLTFIVFMAVFVVAGLFFGRSI